MARSGKAAAGLPDREMSRKKEAETLVAGTATELGEQVQRA
jgi:hypothetical protein